MSGPLEGVTVVEIQALGPAPFCGMVLADLGATVIRVDRVTASRPVPEGFVQLDLLGRGRKSIAVDVKQPEGVATVLRLVESADALIEGFRPGVMERLGLGPDECLARNPRLVYGRMTGYGQDGPMAQAAGHDINYIALAGCLAHIGPRDGAPVPPINLVGDFGGGGMLLAVGLLAALLETRRTGTGQVVDAAMVDGAALLMTPFHAPGALGERGTNMGDGGAFFYHPYECADGEYVAVGAIEPQFYAELRRLVGLTGPYWNTQLDPAQWPNQTEALAAIFKAKTRAEWCGLLEGTDACFAPVLTMAEARAHPHNVQRETFVEVAGITQPAPAPRFSRTPTATPSAAPPIGFDTERILTSLGVTAEEIVGLLEGCVVASTQVAVPT